MLLRTVSFPDTGSTNINSLAIFEVAVVFVLSWNNFIENILLIKKNFHIEIRVALFGEVVAQNLCVCVCVHAHVSMHNDEMHGWSPLCR